MSIEPGAETFKVAMRLPTGSVSVLMVCAAVGLCMTTGAHASVGGLSPTRTRGATPTPTVPAAPAPGTLPRAFASYGRFVVRPGRLEADRTGFRSLVGDYTSDGLAPLTWTSWTNREATATGWYLRGGDCYPKCLDKDNPSGRWPLVSLRLFSVHHGRFQRMTSIWHRDGQRHTVRQHLIRRPPASYEWASRAGGPYWDDHVRSIPPSPT